MSRHYLKIAYRNLLRHRLFSIINVLGLAIGLAGCLLILLWIRYEFRWDGFHEKIDRIHIVCCTHQRGSDLEYSVGSPPAVGPAFAEEYPEVEYAARMGWGKSVILKHGEQEFRERARSVGRDFFRIFTFEFISGSPELALENPHSIVLSESTARKYFGDEQPLGKTMTLDYTYDVVVTGVIEDMPHASTIQLDLMIPIELEPTLSGNPTQLTTWYNCSFRTYLLLRADTDIAAFNEKIKDRIKQSHAESNTTPFVFPFGKLRLHSIRGRGGFIMVLRLFAMAALVVLLMACVNFMNMATARATSRAKEVGVRKVSGASRGQLVAQFYVESLLHALIAVFLALILVEWFLPTVRDLTGAELAIDYLRDGQFWVGALGLGLLAGLLSGSYPALVLSSFRPANVFRGVLSAGRGGLAFRRALVVAQFAMTTILIAYAATIYAQFNFLNDKPLGHDPRNLLHFRLEGELAERFDSLKAELLEHPGVMSVAEASHSLSGVYWNGGGWHWEGRSPDTDPLVTYLSVGDDWLETAGVELVDGRFFPERRRAVEGTGDPEHDVALTDVLVNERFAEYIGGESAVGKWLTQPTDPDQPRLTIIGVVRDFHYRPVYESIGPMIMMHDVPNWARRAFVRIADREADGALAHIEEVFHRYTPDRLFEYTFVEDEIEGGYRFAKARADMFRDFGILAIVISCLGLFGLAAYVTEQRSKEIGIRRVLGAPIGGIVLLLTKQFVRWVLIANAIALPPAMILSYTWLLQFPYRAGLPVTAIVLTVVISIALAALTVSFRATRAALANPAEAIHYQ
jgi:predicted permease